MFSIFLDFQEDSICRHYEVGEQSYNRIKTSFAIDDDSKDCKMAHYDDCLEHVFGVYRLLFGAELFVVEQLIYI